MSLGRKFSRWGQSHAPRGMRRRFVDPSTIAKDPNETYRPPWVHKDNERHEHRQGKKGPD